MNRAPLAWKLLLFLWLLWICQAACPQEMGCGSPKHKVWGWGSNEDYNNQKDLYFCLETWLGLVNCFGPVPRKCGILLSLSSPCTHSMRYLHMRRRLRQQMLQKGNQWIFIQILHSCSSPLLPHCLLFLIHEDGSEWGSVCHVRLGHSCGGGCSALGSRNLVIKSILTCSSRAVKHSTSAREPLTRPEWEKGANCRHPPLNEVYLHEPLMK